MTARFVLDEASWAGSASLAQPVIDAFGLLAERLDMARERNEEVCRHEDFYAASTGGETIADLLYEPTRLEMVDHDLCQRLSLALDRATIFDDAFLSAFDATYLGASRFTPGVCWAHMRAGQRHIVAVLILPLEPGLRGVLSVEVASVQRPLHFVTTSSDHVAFFRAVITDESVDHEGVRILAPSAFPELDWVDTVWNDLRVHKGYFLGENLPALIKHLGALNDHGAKLFHQTPGGADVELGLGSQGVDASPENGRTRANNACKQDRTRQYEGKDQVFWWHTKIRWDLGRIHFLHVPKTNERTGRPLEGHIVIGLFKDHCKLPGNE